MYNLDQKERCGEYERLEILSNQKRISISNIKSSYSLRYTWVRVVRKLMRGKIN